MSRRRNRKKLPPLVWALVLIAFVLLRVYYGDDLTETQPKATRPTALEPGIYRVKRVVDGDTLVLANEGRVRLIGADTPETVMPDHPVEPWGPEATEFTRHLVAGREVRLEMDGRRIDKYGRFLAHVWVGDRMLEEELARAGLARAMTKYKFSQAVKDRLIAAEDEAKAARRGIWSR